MLEDAIKELSNKKETPKAKVDLKLAVSAYISDEIVAEDRLRLELYRRLSLCETPTEVYEIEEEVTERFGRPDGPTKQFFELMVIKLLGLEKNIKMLSSYGRTSRSNISTAPKSTSTPTVKTTTISCALYCNTCVRRNRRYSESGFIPIGREGING